MGTRVAVTSKAQGCASEVVLSFFRVRRQASATRLQRRRQRTWARRANDWICGARSFSASAFPNNLRGSASSASSKAQGAMDEDEVAKISLKSSDEQVFEVDPEVAHMSETIKNMMEDTDPSQMIPLPNVTGSVLTKVIEYCKYKVASKGPKEGEKADSKSDDEVKNWENDFVKVDQGTLFQLILAANYLNIKELLDLTCYTVANMIRGKSPEEIRKAFNIKNDFTPEDRRKCAGSTSGRSTKERAWERRNACKTN